MRILIVDDELVSRTKLETLMGSMGACQAADCGTEALALYEDALAQGHGFDLVMLDIDMPDLQGQDVLKRLREIENFGPHRAAVVMVTARSDQDHVLICLKTGCDDYIAKPFNREVIIEKLVNLGLVDAPTRSHDPLPIESPKSADQIFQEVYTALRSGGLRLPVLPQIAIQFRDLVQSNADVDQMSRLLKQDMALAANLVRVANSALYRGFGDVQNVEQAIKRLGQTETEQMVTALANQKLFKIDRPKYKEAMQNLWQHSLASAYATEILARSLARRLVIEPFYAGLFHDIGVLALLHIISKMEEGGRYDEDIDTQALNETIENYHAMFGAKVLEIWGFESDYIRTTLCHNSLHTAESLTTELLLVHLGNLVAKSLGYSADGRTLEIDLIETQSAKKLQLGSPQIEMLKESVEEHMTNSVGMMT